MLEDLSKKIDDLELELAGLKMQFAQESCPYKIGDKGIIDASSHRGKVGVVTKIVYRGGWNPKHGWIAYLDIYNKDGGKSLRTGELRSYDKLIIE